MEIAYATHLTISKKINKNSFKMKLSKRMEDDFILRD